MYSCRILADSVAPNFSRLTTFEITYPRFVHSELMTHRVFSRNTASSRALPVQRLIDQVNNDPVLPVWWGKTQPGMVADSELDGPAQNEARTRWLFARSRAVLSARDLLELGLHKQITNRLLEPWMWITAIVTATEWDNFFELRCAPDAQPEICKIAQMMRDVRMYNLPNHMHEGQLHLPLVTQDDIYDVHTRYFDTALESLALHAAVEADLMRISVGRCARVSYLTHDGKRDIQADIDLCDRLLKSKHMSPFEHVARAMPVLTDAQVQYIGVRRQGKLITYSDVLRQYQSSGNFVGWSQYRKELGY